ncbi:unnamed protein product [Camellia sinensis]
MDVLYRTGETQQGILTYTPRLLLIGFQDCFCVSYCGYLFLCTKSTYSIYGIYLCTILCFGNTVFLNVIFNLDELYLVRMNLYDTWNKML